MSVHSRHCCAIHGCKYGDEFCPVEKNLEKAEFPCEQCGWENGTENLLTRLDALEQRVKKLEAKSTLHHGRVGPM